MVSFITQAVSRQADICELLIRDGPNRWYTYVRDVPEEECLHEDELVEEDRFIRQEVVFKESLTKMCISKKETVRTNSPHSDPDFTTQDLALSYQHNERFSKQPLVFIPLLDSEAEVVGVLRCFWNTVYPPQF